MRRRIKKQGLKIFTPKTHIVCSHAVAPQGCSQCPVRAALESDGMQECQVEQMAVWAGDQSLARGGWKLSAVSSSDLQDLG